MYHYTKEGARTLPVWRTSNIFIDFHCVCPFSRVSGVLAGHIEPCDPSSVQDKQKQAVLEFFFWICDYAGLLQLSCALWVSWQTGLLLRGGNLKATGRISEPLRMWLSENRMCLCLSSLSLKFSEKPSVKTFKRHVCVISSKWQKKMEKF